MSSIFSQIIVDGTGKYILKNFIFNRKYFSEKQGKMDYDQYLLECLFYNFFRNFLKMLLNG